LRWCNPRFTAPGAIVAWRPFLHQPSVPAAATASCPSPGEWA
jgi:hypothetical protein